MIIYQFNYDFYIGKSRLYFHVTKGTGQFIKLSCSNNSI